MLTRAQKKQKVDEGAKLIKESKNLIFADFSGVPVTEIQRLKNELREAGAKFQVLKKRLLKIAIKRAGADFDPTQFEAQVGTFFLSEDLTSVASKIHKFSKDLAKKGKNFTVLSAYDLEKKTALSAEEFTAIAKLPTREVLIAMIMGGITGPLRAFMSIVKQLSERQPTDTKGAELREEKSKVETEKVEESNQPLATSQ